MHSVCVEDKKCMPLLYIVMQYSCWVCHAPTCI